MCNHPSPATIKSQRPDYRKGPRLSRNRISFTLIELLVVVTILGILFAILLPTLQRAKKQARQVSCISNLKQCGSVTNIYLGDWNEWIFDEGNDSTYSWASMLRDNSYMENWHVAQCPSMPPFYIVNTYGMDPAAPFKLMSYCNPATRLLMIDSIFTSTLRQTVKCSWNATIPGRMIHPRHLQQANVLLCDAHVESRIPEVNLKFPVKTSSWQMKTWSYYLP